MQFQDTQANLVDFVVHFILKDHNTNDKKHFAVPVYIFINNNAVDLYPPVLDFGILYSNSDFSNKIHVRAKSPNGDAVRVGRPYLHGKQHLDYDFTSLVSNNGYAVPDNAYLVGTITLKTQGLKEGNYTGQVIFMCIEED